MSKKGNLKCNEEYMLRIHRVCTQNVKKLQVLIT